jgi:cobalt/nickel transport system permease protein
VRPAAIERWSSGSSPVHRRDPRFKLLALLALLIGIGTAYRPPELLLCGGIVLTGLVLARLPLGGVLARAAVVLPFSGSFALLAALAGDPLRAVLLLARSYCSATAVVVFAGTTPMPELLDGLRRLGCPRALILVAQFVYRFLFVTVEQAGSMRRAAQARGAGGNRRASFTAAAGSVAALFARALSRAERVHRAMMARGFTGRFALLNPRPAAAADWLLLLLTVATLVAIRSR